MIGFLGPAAVIRASRSCSGKDRPTITVFEKSSVRQPLSWNVRQTGDQTPGQVSLVHVKWTRDFARYWNGESRNLAVRKPLKAFPRAFSPVLSSRTRTPSPRSSIAIWRRTARTRAARAFAPRFKPSRRIHYSSRSSMRPRLGSTRRSWRRVNENAAPTTRFQESQRKLLHDGRSMRKRSGTPNAAGRSHGK